MKTKAITFAALVAVLFLGSGVIAQTKDTVELQGRLKRVESEIAEIRRDQINYRIEKDLLKETFSSNYQTINIVLAIVLGVFGIVGYLGIRDIGAMKKEYLAELEKIGDLRKDLEVKVSKIGEEQQKAKDDYLEIIKTNEDQSRRIKVLELQEKISSLLQMGAHQRALEYVAVALPLDPDNTVLLGQKASCLWKLNDLNGAILVFSEILKYDPTHRNAILNQLELYLIANRIPDFEELYAKNKSWVDQRDNSVLSMYFDLLKHYQLAQDDQAKTLVRKYVEECPAEQKRLTSWSFDEILGFLKDQADTRRKRCLTIFVSLISGNISRDEAIKAIEEQTRKT